LSNADKGAVGLIPALELASLTQVQQQQEAVTQFHSGQLERIIHQSQCLQLEKILWQQDEINNDYQA